MSSYSLVNVTATEMLPQGTVLRVTFSPAALNTATHFTNDVNRIYDALIGNKFSPISPDPAIKDGKPAVVDIRLYHASILSDVAQDLASIAGMWANVSRIERLTDTQAAVASGNQGAQDREAIKAAQDKQNSDNGIFASIGKALGIAKHVLIAVVVVAAIIAVVVYHREISAGLKRFRK